MSLDPDSKARFNLKSATVLLVESGLMDMDILVHIVVGFGCRQITKAEDLESAKQAISRTSFDLIIADMALGEEDGANLALWLRRDAPPDQRSIPLLMIAPHTPLSKVKKARDCGAHFVIAKPLTPIVLLERILWIAREQRPLVTCKSYAGPDRRFKYDGPPVGEEGRRSDDLTGDVGHATAPNMSQEQIDALMQPRKVIL